MAAEDKYIETTVQVNQAYGYVSITATYSGRGDDLWILSLGYWDETKNWDDNKIWVD